MHDHYGPPIGSRPPAVEWWSDRWRHLLCKKKGTKSS